VGREHRADRRHHDVERLVVERQVLGVGLGPVELNPVGLRAAPARLQQLGRQVAGDDVRAALLDFVGDVLPFLFTGGVILFLYCVLPMQRQRPRDVWPGVLVAVALLAILREGLELYFEELTDLGALYGSLGALMALLLFVYAASIVLLFGAEFASEWTRLPDQAEITRRVRAGRRRLLRVVHRD